VKVSIRSFIPVGSGLGSSAAFSVSLASALLLWFGHIAADNRDFGLHVDQQEIINSWAFKAETINHGNPSGVDNSISVFGASGLKPSPLCQ
jgi:mevalonate kinase